MNRSILPAGLLLCSLLAAPAAHAQFEAAGAGATFTVTTTADSGAGSLRQQLTLATPGAAITFASPLFDTPQTIELLSALPALANNLALQGPGANLLTLRRADAAPGFRILHAPQTAGVVTISGITIANGYTPATEIDAGSGAGLLVEREFLVDGVHITGNHAGGDAGGMLVGTAGGIIINSTFSNNTTGPIGAGGALMILPAPTPVRVVNSTFSGNTAVSGAAIRVFAFLPFSSEVELRGLTIHNNTSTAPANSTVQSALRVGATGGATTLVTLRNTLLSSNNGAHIYQRDDSGTSSVVTNDFNLADTNITGYLDGPNDLPGANPGLGPLAYNGGPTPTHALLPDSDAIDAGSNVGSVIMTDQRGFARTTDLPYPQIGDSDATDIGAFEADVVPTLPDPAIFADGFEGD